MLRLVLFGLLASFAIADDAASVICPAGYKAQAGRCFQLFQRNLNWFQARDDCEARGKAATGGRWIGQLAEPRRGIDFDFLDSLVPAGVRPTAWLGSRADSIGAAFDFNTDSEQLPTPFRWAAGQPNTYRKSAACLLLWKWGRGYGDDSCNQPSATNDHFYICELVPENVYEELLFCNGAPEKVMPNSVRPVNFPRKIGVSVKLTCRYGYRMDERFKVTEAYCRKRPTDNKPFWTPCGECVEIDPYCKRNPSDAIKNSAVPKEGSFTKTVDDTVTLECQIGFHVVPDGARSLLAACVGKSASEGEWESANSCSAIEKYCDTRPNRIVPKSETPTFKFSRELGTRVNVQCIRGYTPKFGASVVTVCSAHTPKNGIWITDNECREILEYCSSTPHNKFTNTVAARQGTFARSLGSQAKLECHYGYKTAGGFYLLATCQGWTVREGEWTSKESCSPIAHYCDLAPQKPIPNAAAPKAGTFSRAIGSIVTVECQPGYKGAWTARVTSHCVALSATAGKWFSTAKCAEIELYCNNKPQVGFANVVTPKAGSFARRLNSRTTLQCRQGYRPNAGKVIEVTCKAKTLEQGEWESPQYCIPIPEYCTDTPHLVTTNVALAPTGSYTRKIEDTVVLTCEYGYRSTVHDFHATCAGYNLTHGEWQTQGRCNAIPDYCSDKPEAEVTKGLHPPSFTQTVGSRVEIKCSFGWTPRGLGVFATCTTHNENNGRWTIEGECICEKDATKKPCNRFTYAALQNGKQCFCDYAYGKYGRAESCNMKCTGSNEICGGVWASNIYKIEGRRAEYLGCFNDRAQRDLTGAFFSSPAQSVGGCVKLCAEKGFKYAALQLSSQCFCGNSYGKYGAASPCNTKCANSNDICGGTWASQVYALSGPGKGHLVGCFVDKPARDLTGASAGGSYMSVGWCLNWCYRKGCEL